MRAVGRSAKAPEGAHINSWQMEEGVLNDRRPIFCCQVEYVTFLKQCVTRDVDSPHHT